MLYFVSELSENVNNFNIYNVVIILVEALYDKILVKITIPLILYIAILGIL